MAGAVHYNYQGRCPSEFGLHVSSTFRSKSSPAHSFSDLLGISNATPWPSDPDHLLSRVDVDLYGQDESPVYEVTAFGFPVNFPQQTSQTKELILGMFILE